MSNIPVSPIQPQGKAAAPQPHRGTEVMIHVIGWLIAFGFPILMMNRNTAEIDLSAYLRHGIVLPLTCLIAFYFNYILLTPRLLFAGKMRSFILANLCLVVLLSLCTLMWHDFNMPTETIVQAGPEIRPRKPHPGPPATVFFLRDALTILLCVGMSVAIKMSGRWIQIENARKEAEKKQAEAERQKAEAERQRTEAELTNLRSQLNPHFLLNTLNNIYALIAFDATRAQTAVQELSRLLRHVLYDNRQSFVPLSQEIDFIRNYIELMRIRLTPQVRLTVEINIAPDSRTPIAPLLYISLIENAFKHGISSTEPSYIDILFSEDEHRIVCNIRNSYFPKTHTDKSGSGIGLEQVARRLELSYAGRYEWTKGVSEDGKEYESRISISK